MKIYIVCSLSFSKQAGELKLKLESGGHSVQLPPTVEKIVEGRISYEEVMGMKDKGNLFEFTKAHDLIRQNWERMQSKDAVLVINMDKNGVKNYIGGNVFLEMGFTHVLKKKIFLWNDIPEMSYSDEIKAMQPVVLNQDIDKLR